MVDAAIKAGTPPAAPPATDEADIAMLSEFAGLAMELARGFQAEWRRLQMLAHIHRQG